MAVRPRPREIVAGALRDHRRAVVIGTLSFGKGSVQTIIPLGSGEGALRLTTARYHTPSGRSIRRTASRPDWEVHAKPKDSTRETGRRATAAPRPRCPAI